MLKWLKDKAEKAAARQCKVNIRLNTKTLVMRSNSAHDRIEATGTHNDADVASVHSAQESLLVDIQLGIANGLQIDDITEVIEESTVDMEVSNGARIALDHVLKSVDQ